MTADDNLTPQERLAKIVAEETDGGRSVVRFFMQVADGERDHEGFKPNHRMDSAKELVKIGLTEFEDYINSHPASTKRRPPKSKRVPDTELSPEIEEAREELARYARDLTQDGRTVIRLYSEIMDGFRDTEGFKPHHRMAAAKELLLRGFGPVSAWPAPIPETQPQSLPVPVPVAEPQTHPTLVLTPTVSEYLSEAVDSYERTSPYRELLPQWIMDRIDSDEPLDDCPCAIAEDEGRDIPCPENEECPYYGIKWPEFSEEDRERMKEWDSARPQNARRDVRLRKPLRTRPMTAGIPQN